MKTAWVITVTVLATGLLAILPLPPAAAAPPTYVGPAICIRCHLDYAKLWTTVDHSKKLLEEGRPAAQKGCEACHGPGGEHVAGRRKQIVSWRRLGVAERAQVCLQCHTETVPAGPWKASAHGQKLSCDQCHEVHRPTKSEHLLRSAPDAPCLPCHEGLAAKIAAKRHHTLADGALTCDVCHATHGSEHPHLLKEPQGESCKTCHGDDVPRPETHQKDGWKLKHGADSKGQEDSCRMCHDRDSFCNRCHAVPVPHPENFAIEHTALARQRQETCMQCHEAEFCKMCHDEVPVKAAAAAQ